MPGKTSNSDMNSPDRESKIIGKCLEEEKCMHSLHLIVDGEATEDEEKYFLRHLQDCLPCFNLYKLEKAVKELVQSKIEKKPVPLTVLRSIRNKIRDIKETA